MSFNQRLQSTIERQRSVICVGLDPVLERLPAGIERTATGVLDFNLQIIEATSEWVCAYKPNSAFYEALGSVGWDVLKQTIAAVPKHIPVILDAKRGDIGSTAEAYAEAAFKELQADAITLNPYLGSDSLEPFLQHAERGCIILCRTSNPGSAIIQDQALANGLLLYEYIAQLTQSNWNHNNNCSLVVGATRPSELVRVRELAPDVPLLIPGVGAQGGDMTNVLAISGTMGIINVSRSILYTDSGPSWLEAVVKRTQAYYNASQTLWN